jgi:hypothetical protein
MVLYHRTISSFPSFQHQIERFFMSLETQNKKLQMSFEPQKQRNKAENAGRERMIFCLKFCL